MRRVEGDALGQEEMGVVAADRLARSERCDIGESRRIEDLDTLIDLVDDQDMAVHRIDRDAGRIVEMR
ncbi:MAG: hypothetical protein WDN69_05345 [Aliidongia sp.]